MKFIVDTRVWIDYLNGNPNREVNLLDAKIGKNTIIIGDLIMLEILQGIRDDIQFKKTRSALEEFIIVQMMGSKYTVEYASMYRDLRKNGITIRKTTDLIIAGYCILNNLPLLQRDRDFKPFEKYLGLELL